MRVLLTIVLATLVPGGCAGGNIFARLDDNLSRGDCPAAIALIDDSADAYGSNAQLLYLLDAAMVYLQCGDLEAAQAHFQSADDLAERLWTESIARHTLSLVTNDRVLPYAGEDFERVMIHLMSAIAYLQAEQPDEALVETRRLDTLLAVYNDKYEKKNVYKEDAFARYLSGILREADGEWDEAFIDYRRAAEVYLNDYRAYGTELPEMLEVDLVRAAVKTDRLADISGIVSAERIDALRRSNRQRDQGKVVFITFAGYAPEKVQDMAVAPSPQGPIGVAFPRMVITPPHCDRGRLYLASEERHFETDLVLVEDINRIALKNLDDRQSRILGKAVARAVAKQAAIYGISRSASDDRNSQQAIASILNLANILLTERADTRNWRTLPGRIYMTRLRVPAGEYKVALHACDEMAADLGPLTVAPGSTHFLFRDLRYPPAPNDETHGESQ